MGEPGPMDGGPGGDPMGEPGPMDGGPGGDPICSLHDQWMVDQS